MNQLTYMLYYIFDHIMYILYLLQTMLKFNSNNSGKCKLNYVKMDVFSVYIKQKDADTANVTLCCFA